MLHDPRHDREPSLAGFALFVASKPANEVYDWHNSQKCACGQYLHSIGRHDINDWAEHSVLNRANQLARGGLPWASKPDAWTFGQLADRILEYQRTH
jgi:hypothetical protein